MNKKKHIPNKPISYEQNDLLCINKDSVEQRTAEFEILLKEKPYLKDYAVHFMSSDYFLISKAISTHEDALNNTVRKIESESEDLFAEYERFDLETEKYCIYLRHHFEYMSTFAYIFVKEKFINDFRDEFTLVSTEYYKPGSYHMMKSSSGFYLKKIDVTNEKEPIFNNDLKNTIQKDIDFFFENEKVFKENNLNYKRGILLFGPPGTGKSSLIKNVINQNKEKYHCIMVDEIREWDKIKGDFIKQATNNKKRIVIIEDIDGLEQYSRSEFLNFVDGVEKSENMLLIATSNDVTKIDPALVNRPSRFDRVYNIGLPTEETRKKLLNLYLPELKKSEISDCVNASKGFSGAYFKELFLCSKLNPDKKVVQLIKELQIQIKQYAHNAHDLKEDIADEGYFG